MSKQIGAASEAREQFVWIDGDFVSIRNATIPMSSAGARYGLNVFEGICGYASHDGTDVFIFRLREHVKRLGESARIMQVSCGFPPERMEQAVLETVRRNAVHCDCQARLTIFVTGDGNCATRGPTSLVCIVTPRTPRPFDARGVTAGITSWRRISDDIMPPRVKAGANYLNGRYGLLEAVTNGHDEAIFLTTTGKVAEASSSCLFIVKDGQVVTTPATSSILESITRDTIVQIASANGMQVVIREIDRTELYLCDEAFLCGSHYEITPIKRIDGFNIGNLTPGPVTTALWTLYAGVIRGAIRSGPAQVGDWLSSAYG